jgi:ribonuclease-3
VPSTVGGLYEVALTHKSFAVEHPGADHNERLEWLGDAVLKIFVADLLYRDYPELSEGDMSLIAASVINNDFLGGIARSLGIDEAVRLGRGEEVNGGRNNSRLLGSALEALVGAVFSDQGWDAVRSELTPLFAPKIEAAVDSDERFDVKTALLERVIKLQGVPPTFKVIPSGPDHKKHFAASVYVGADLVGRGSGPSKKRAEYEAAREALAHLQREDDARSIEGGRDARAS